MEIYHRPLLRALSGFFGNISAAWFAIPFIGSGISFPKDIKDFFVLTLDIGFAIVFLIISVLCEKELEK